MHNAPLSLKRIAGLAALGLVLLLALPAQKALSHEFVVALRAVGMEQETVLPDALRGFLLATAEQDGHAGETSNGHLGGLDVYILAQPDGLIAGIPDLKTAPGDGPDIIVVIGSNDAVATEIEKTGSDSVVISPGTLSSANNWPVDNTQDPVGFAARYASAFSQPASRWAAEGYNAARRIDAAIRSLGGVSNRAALESAFAASADGIQW
tara:strand:- start:5740 stop:6366 length:627 start_codon:yes stop_codon:yes gene_type:complete